MAANDFKTIARMVEHWRSSGVKLRHPATEVGIVAFEQRFGVRLPLDMRHYFLLTDGMDYGAWDNNNFSFWELERLRPLAEQLPEPIHASYRNFPDAKCFFCFADWLIDCTVFSIKLSANVSDSNVCRSLERKFSFRSFSEFVDAYLSDAYRNLI